MKTGVFARKAAYSPKRYKMLAPAFGEIAAPAYVADDHPRNERGQHADQLQAFSHQVM